MKHPRLHPLYAADSQLSGGDDPDQESDPKDISEDDLSQAIAGGLTDADRDPDPEPDPIDDPPRLA